MQFHVFEVIRSLHPNPPSWGVVDVFFRRMGQVFVEAPDAESALKRAKERFPLLHRRLAVGARYEGTASLDVVEEDGSHGTVHSSVGASRG